MSILQEQTADRITSGSVAGRSSASPQEPEAKAASEGEQSRWQVTVIRPQPGWRALDLGEIWQYRDLFVTLGVRDIKVRYKQTALGAIWVVLQPLISAGIFSIVFGMLAGIKTDRPLPLFTYAGMLAWGVFSGMFSKVAVSMVGNTALVSKIYFPRLILPFSNAFATLLDFVVALGVLGVLMALFHIAPHAGLLLMPVFLLLLMLLATGIGLVAAAIGVKYRDAMAVTPFLLQILQYASGIQYPLSLVREKLSPALQMLFFANPLVSLIEAFRWSLIGGAAPPWALVGTASAVTVALFIGGLFSFKRAEREFADVI